MLELETETTELRFALLGPIRVRRGTEEIAIAAGHQRLLLALLLARAGRPAEISDIAGLLWEGDEAPRTAVNMVHRYVGLLRRSLEPDLTGRGGGRWLVNDTGGYRLAVTARNLDLLDFRARAAQARQLAETGDDPAALDLYLAALSLWRGKCAAGLGFVVEVHPEFWAIEHEFITVTREAAQMALRIGDVQRVLPVLREASVRSPLDEAVHACLLRALAGDGNQAEAIALYARMRARLGEELGVSPGPELREAFQAVLRGRDSVSRPATAEVRELADAVDAGKAAGTGIRPAQLPSDLRLFVGRSAYVDEAVDLLNGGRSSMEVLAYDGMPGVGKTTLAVHVAHRVAGDFTDGQLYVDLHGFDATRRPADPADVLGDLLGALGIDRSGIPPGLDGRASLYRSVLAGRRMLVVLDNAWDADQVRPLLPGTPGNAVLVTSRSRLTSLATVHGAHLSNVDPAPFPEAWEGFIVRLGASRVRAEPDAVREIIERCGHLHLAMAIVAARAAADPDRSLSSIAAELRNGAGTLEAFSDERVDQDPRHVFGWSYQLVSPAAAGLLCLLRHHHDSEITPESAAVLAGLAVPQARQDLYELVKTRLLNRCRPGRYHMHDLVRAYVAELGEEPGWTGPSRPARLGLADAGGRSPDGGSGDRAAERAQGVEAA